MVAAFRTKHILGANSRISIPRSFSFHNRNISPHIDIESSPVCAHHVQRAIISHSIFVAECRNRASPSSIERKEETRRCSTGLCAARVYLLRASERPIRFSFLSPISLLSITRNCCLSRKSFSFRSSGRESLIELENIDCIESRSAIVLIGRLRYNLLRMQIEILIWFSFRTWFDEIFGANWMKFTGLKIVDDFDNLGACNLTMN